MNNNYTISVLLTKQEDWISKIIYYITGRGYTHASIGIDETDETFYSFNIKGFRKEHPKKHKHLITQSLCFKLNASLCLPNNLVNILNSRRMMDAVVLNPI